VNRPSENAGKIHELVIDAGVNHVAYSVFPFAGFMRMGNKLFAVS
jgi:hypothetical protein